MLLDSGDAAFEVLRMSRLIQEANTVIDTASVLVKLTRDSAKRYQLEDVVPVVTPQSRILLK
jgi:hypothetical protein